MTLRLAHSMSEIEPFILSEEYLIEIAEDNTELEGLLKALEKTSHQDYLIYEQDGIDMGFVSIRPITNSCLLIHPFLFRTYRKHVRELMKDLYAKLLSTDNSINKLVACVPISRPNIINWAKNVGMIIEGINHGAYYKGGDYQDCYWMGITKEQMYAYLEREKDNG